MKSKTILGYQKDFGAPAIKANLLRLAGQLRGRNRAVFLAQLLFALWLLAAKAIVTDEGRSKSMGAPSAKKKPALIDRLFKQLRKIFPGLPLRRMLDSWCDCLLGALIEMRVIKLPPRRRGQKHQKVELKHLRKVRKSHLLQILKDYESMAELRDTLFPPEKKTAKVKDDELLELTHQFLLKKPALNDEKLGKLRAIKEAAEAILASVGSSPTDEQPPATSSSSSSSSSLSSSSAASAPAAAPAPTEPAAPPQRKPKLRNPKKHANGAPKGVDDNTPFLPFPESIPTRN